MLSRIDTVEVMRASKQSLREMAIIASGWKMKTAKNDNVELAIRDFREFASEHAKYSDLETIHAASQLIYDAILNITQRDIQEEIAQRGQGG